MMEGVKPPPKGVRVLPVEADEEAQTDRRHNADSADAGEEEAKTSVGGTVGRALLQVGDGGDEEAGEEEDLWACQEYLRDVRVKVSIMGGGLVSVPGPCRCIAPFELSFITMLCSNIYSRYGGCTVMFLLRPLSLSLSLSLSLHPPSPSPHLLGFASVGVGLRDHHLHLLHTGQSPRSHPGELAGSRPGPSSARARTIGLLFESMKETHFISVMVC